MTQIRFDLKDAHEALDDFLGGDRDHDGERMERWLAGEDGEPAAYLVSAAHMHRIREGYRAWAEVQDVREQAAEEPPGYKPYRHSPLSKGDRLLPTEPLHDPLARIIYGKDFAGCDDREQIKVTGTAIMAILRTTFDPDALGIVPVMSVGHEGDDPGTGPRWQLVFVTGVPGLFTRVSGNNFIGDEWAIVTGSGYRLAQGWLSQEMANRAADALGRVLPDTDWMRLTPDSFTAEAKRAVGAVVKRYHYLGLREDSPEPEVVTGAVPAEEVSAGA